MKAAGAIESTRTTTSGGCRRINTPTNPVSVSSTPTPSRTYQARCGLTRSMERKTTVVISPTNK